MRQDMKKVIVERPRVRAGSYRKPARPAFCCTELDADGNSLPGRASLTKAICNNGKDQTDLLGPVRRFLRRRVGRPWNDVWSEICEHSRDFLGSHLKRHIEWMVVLHVSRDDRGELVDREGRVLEGGRQRLYVSPVDGTLQITALERRRTLVRRWSPGIVTLNGQEYYQHQGVWYRVQTKAWLRGRVPRAAVERTETFEDVFGNGCVDGHGFAIEAKLLRTYGKLVYCVEKQQARSRECRKLNRLTPN